MIYHKRIGYIKIKLKLDNLLIEEVEIDLYLCLLTFLCLKCAAQIIEAIHFYFDWTLMIEQKPCIQTKHHIIICYHKHASQTWSLHTADFGSFSSWTQTLTGCPRFRRRTSPTCWPPCIWSYVSRTDRRKMRANTATSPTPAMRSL